MRKYIIMVIFTFILASMALPATVKASYMDDPIDLDTLLQINQQLRDEIDRLTRMLEDVIQSPPTPPPAPSPRPAHAPNVRLVQPQSVVLVPGEPLYVDIVVRNIGRGQAINTLASATTEGPFTIEFLDNTNAIGLLGENSNRTLRVRLVPSANAAAGTFALNLQFAFRSRDANIDGVSNDSISVRIDRQAQISQLSLRDFFVNTPSILPGDGFVISAQLANFGTGSAYGIQVGIVDGLDADGIFLFGNPDSPFHQVLHAGHRSTISFGFMASNRISSGTFPIVFEISGRDSAGEEISEKFTYFVTVVAPAGGTGRAFISLNTAGPIGAFSPNERANVSVTVTNNGTTAARNIRVTANPEDGLVPQSASVEAIQVLEPGESRQLTFVFSPTAEANSQYHMVGFAVDYSTGIGDETESFTQYVGINVYNPDREPEEATRGSRPRMLVSAYSVYPRIVPAGEEFDLFLTFQNSSSTRSVYNIKITLQAVEHTERQGAVFTPVGASNTIFVESLGPRETVDRELRMFTVPNADPRTYNIEVTFEYEDEDFEEFTEVEQISVNVRQVTRLEVSNLQMPDHAMLGHPIFVDFNIINSGRVTLANLRVELEGNFDTRNINIHVGNMGRGNSTSFSGNFTPMEPGEQHGALMVSGEDESGELVYYRHEFIIFVDDMPPWDESMMFDRDMMFDDSMMFGEESGVFGIAFLRMWMLIVLAVPVSGAVVAGGIVKKNLLE